MLNVLVERYKTELDTYLKVLPEDERKLGLSKIKHKKTTQKTELKVVPRINAGEKIPEKPKKKVVSKYSSKSNTFENEPNAVPFKNAFELYKSKFKENSEFEPKKPIEAQVLLEWNTLSDRKKFVFEGEFKTIRREYMKKVHLFLKSLSVEDLKLYIKLRYPELIINNTENESGDSSGSENSYSS